MFGVVYIQALRYVFRVQGLASGNDNFTVTSPRINSNLILPGVATVKTEADAGLINK